MVGPPATMGIYAFKDGTQLYTLTNHPLMNSDVFGLPAIAAAFASSHDAGAGAETFPPFPPPPLEVTSPSPRLLFSGESRALPPMLEPPMFWAATK